MSPANLPGITSSGGLSKGRGCWWGANAREQEAECLEAGTPLQAEPEEQERREGEQTGGRVDRLEALLIMGVQGVTEAPG